MNTRLWSRPLLSAALLFSTASAAYAKDAPSYSITAHIHGEDGGWDYANVDTNLNRLFVARANAVMAVDLATRHVVSTLAVAEHGHQVLVLPEGNEIVSTNGDSNIVRFLDARTGALKAAIKVGEKPDAAIYDPATRLVAVMNADDGTLSLLDPKTHTLVGSITIGGGLEYGVADGAGMLFVNIEDRNQIAVVDMRKRTVVRRITLTGCDGPTGLAMVAGGTRLISACANNVAVVTNPAAGVVTGTMPIGGDPDAVLSDAKRGLAFIPCGKDGVLEMIAAAKPDAIRSLGRIPTAVSAKTGALDPHTGNIYLPSAQLLPAEPGAKRGKSKPGTFEVLVLSPKH